MQHSTGILLIIILFLFGKTLTGQTSAKSSLALPKVQPSYLKNISQDNAINITVTCFRDLLEGKDGRIWLNLCATSSSYFSLHLIHYDGYQVEPVNLGNQPLLANTAATLTGIGSQGEVIGFSQSKKTNIVFVIDPETYELDYFDFASFEIKGFQVRNVIPDRDGGLLVLGSGENSIHLFSVRDGKMKSLAEAPIETEAPSIFETRPYVQKLPLLQTEKGIWFMEEFFPLFFYETTSGKLIQMDPSTHLPEEVWGKLAERDFRFYSAPNLIRNKNGAILYHPSYSPFFFSLQAPGSDLQLVEGFPAQWRSRGVFQDEKGNTLFLFYDEKNDYKAIVEDTAGVRYDYSDFTSGIKTKIFSVVGKDFFQHMYVCAANNLLSAGVRRLPVIRTIEVLTSRNPQTAFLNRQFLFYDQEEAPIFIDPYDKGDPLSPQAHFNAPCLNHILNAKEKIKNLITNEQGKQWFIQTNNIIEFDPLDQSCRSYPIQEGITHISIVDNGLLAFLSNNGTPGLFDTKTKKLSRINIDEIPPSQVFTLHATPDSILWATTSNGLWKVDVPDKTTEVIGFDVGFQDFRFQSFLEDQNGIFWLGSFMAGVHRYDRKTKEVKVVGEKQGLPSDVVRSLVEDEEGIIWATTNNGLSLISPQGDVLTTITDKDGMPSNRYRRFGAAKSPEGLLFFTTTNGGALIDPARLKSQVLENPYSANIFLTSLTYFDKIQKKEITKTGAINPNRKIYLPPGRRYLKIKMALSNYINPEENLFAYKLEGKEEDWTYLSDRHELVLNHLPPGKYRLLIKGADYRNNWTAEPLALSIQADDFFYNRPWFYVLLFSSAAFIVFFWIRRLRFEKMRLEAEVKRRTRQISRDKELIEEQARELRQLDELKSRFFTNISHELRTPITLITAPVEQLLSNSAKLGQSVQNRLSLVLNNGRKLLRLVEELLDLSLLESNKVQLKVSPTLLLVFCRRLFSAFHSQAEMKRIDYQFHCDLDEQAQFWIDQNRLEKIVNNLLSNALKFTRSQGKVHLILTKVQNDILIQVEDSGRGVPPEDLPHIFERYFQTKRKSIATEGGTGIGLALSSELARLMKGKLSVKSEWGKGSTFSLRFPVRIVEIEADIESLESRPLSPLPLSPIVAEKPGAVSGLDIISNNQDKFSVVIVEDNPDMQQLIASLLAEDYSCRIANNGAEAWAFLERGSLDPQDVELIISDVMMPEMDGYAFLNHLKKDPTWHKTPVIMLTARSAEEDKLKALRLGVDDYLIKPFSPRELQLRVANLINNGRKRKEFLQQKTSRIDVQFEKTPTVDQTWLSDLEAAAKTALDKQLDLNRNYLANQMVLSDRQLLRRLKSLTGLTIHQYILEIKLQKARHLLENKTYHTAAEVAYACGFNSPNYFSRLFEKHYGKRPIEY